MKKLLCLALIALSLSAQAQIRKTKRVSGHSFHIWGDDFEGVVFTDKYKEWNSAEGKSFTPAINDIELAEACLRQRVSIRLLQDIHIPTQSRSNMPIAEKV
jgi:hypothetical protein